MGIAEKEDHKENKKDCYFDHECHSKVDWEKVGFLKGGFFVRLKILKESKDFGALKALWVGMHKRLAAVGVPEDKIDYMLKKWVRFVWPEAVGEDAPAKELV